METKAFAVSLDQLRCAEAARPRAEVGALEANPRRPGDPPKRVVVSLDHPDSAEAARPQAEVGALEANPRRPGDPPKRVVISLDHPDSAEAARPRAEVGALEAGPRRPTDPLKAVVAPDQFDCAEVDDLEAGPDGRSGSRGRSESEARRRASSGSGGRARSPGGRRSGSSAESRWRRKTRSRSGSRSSSRPYTPRPSTPTTGLSVARYQLDGAEAARPRAEVGTPRATPRRSTNFVEPVVAPDPLDDRPRAVVGTLEASPRGPAPPKPLAVASDQLGDWPRAEVGTLKASPRGPAPPKPVVVASDELDTAEVDDIEFGPDERHRPVFILVTLVFCTAALVWEFFENGRAHSQGAQQSSDKCHFRFDIGSTVFCAAKFSVNPFFGPSTETLIKMGAGDGPLTAKGEVWRLVTPMYLHGGMVHFVCNMLVFCCCGLDLERDHGWVRVAAIYFLSGVFGLLLGAALAPHMVKVGSSGGIFGLFGAVLGQILQNWSLYRSPWRAVMQLCSTVSVQFLLGTMPMVDNFSHLFGFIMGFLSSLVLLVMKRDDVEGKRLSTKCHQRLMQAVATACIILLFLLGFLMAFGPVHATDVCPRCDLISCIPFPWGCDPDEKGSCWGWDCSDSQVSRCEGSATWIGSAHNGTVLLECPNGLVGTLDVQVWPVDVSDWGTPALVELCKAHCPRAW